MRLIIHTGRITTLAEFTRTVIMQRMMAVCIVVLGVMSTGIVVLAAELLPTIRSLPVLIVCGRLRMFELTPSHIKTTTERTLWEQLQRERQVISAMQHRTKRNPVRDLLLRKPWKSPTKPHGWRDFWQWLVCAHDCSDPAVGCSCSGGYRFPHRGDENLPSPT